MMIEPAHLISGVDHLHLAGLFRLDLREHLSVVLHELSFSPCLRTDLGARQAVRPLQQLPGRRRGCGRCLRRLAADAAVATKLLTRGER